MRLYPRSLAGRLILLLLLALIVAQGIAFVLFMGERMKAVRLAYQETVIARTASVAQLAADSPPELRARVVRTASTRFLRFSLTEESAVTEPQTDRLARMVGADLAEALGTTPDKVRVEARSPRHAWDRGDNGDDDDDDALRGRGEREHERRHRHWRPRWLVLSVALPDGTWLNAVTGAPPSPPPWGAAFVGSLALSALAVALVAVLVGLRLARPMRRLAEAADRLGRGEQVEAVPEMGPIETRRTIRAFNRMHERLDRFVRDRTAMLAAISHDLRTPITSLRLRAEFVEDEETRNRILATLGEMQQMIEATLAFAREDAAGEETRTVDIEALVDSVVADLADLGHDATFEGRGEGEDKILFACRPIALRRALRNLIENAAIHGTRARVRLELSDEEIWIHVEDDGPGVPETDLERIFEPFVRLEKSRSRETGGIGLGLAIARSIVRNHGGDITLENRAEGGLRATIRLPRTG